MNINNCLVCLIVLLLALGYKFEYPVIIRIALAVAGIVLFARAVYQIRRTYHERKR